MTSAILRHPLTRPFGAGILAAGAAALAVRFAPMIELEIFARAAATLASLFLGAPALRVEAGWLLPVGAQPIVVTTACSAADYFAIVAALFAGQFARRRLSLRLAAVLGFGAALPTAIAVNALRLVAVTHAHLWLTPLLPEAYDASLHLLTGVAVFLPSLVALNLVLEIHVRRHSPARPAEAVVH